MYNFSIFERSLMFTAQTMYYENRTQGT